MPPVEIQWCDHSSVLLEYLRQLYEEGRFVDVGLECETRQVKAHKAVISACSPYLEGLLKGNPARSHLIKFNGYSYTSLRAVIDFMYNGKVMVEQENLAAFLKLGRALQVRGILDIAAQCEEAGLTTPEETKSNAQYSTSVQQSQKANQQKLQQQQQSADSKKYAFLLDKNTGNQQKKGVQYRSKSNTNIIGSVEQQSNVNKGAAQVIQQQQQQQQQQQAQQTLQAATQQQQQAQEQTQQETTATFEELQQALNSGQAILQTSDANGGEQTLQMMEGQCVVTGSGETYVVVQDGNNFSFVPAEMVQGDLQAAVNGGGQVMESLDNVEQQLAQMEGHVLTDNAQVLEAAQQVTSGQDTGTLDTMTVVESLVKLGQKQPGDGDQAASEEQPEIGPDMPSFDAVLPAANAQVLPDMPDLGEATEDTGADESTMDTDSEKGSRQVKVVNIGGVKRRADASPGGRGKKLKN